MINLRNRKIALVAIGALASVAIAAPQLDKIIKVGGVVVAINTFGRQMNDGLNKLWNRKDTSRLKTKVVPILTVGVNSSNAIGAAQVMGPPAQVDKVVAVAQPEARILGNEVRLRAMIPVSSKNVVENIRAVPEVGISGIVDLRL
jgi:hypothetical protein